VPCHAQGKKTVFVNKWYVGTRLGSWDKSPGLRATHARKRSKMNSKLSNKNHFQFSGELPIAYYFGSPKQSSFSNMLIGIVDYALLMRPNKAETVVHHLPRGPFSSPEPRILWLRMSRLFSPSVMREREELWGRDCHAARMIWFCACVRWWPHTSPREWCIVRPTLILASLFLNILLVK